MAKTPDPSGLLLESLRADLFEELTSLQDSFSGRIPTQAKASACLRALDRLETRFQDLKLQIWNFNSLQTDDSDKISTANFPTFAGMFRAIAEKCMEMSAAASPAPGAHSVPATQVQSPRLPRLNLSVFDGTVGEYPAFIALFTSLVDKNTALSDIEKFHYLHAFTEKEAKAIVEGYTLSTENYKLALAALKKRYSDTRRLATYYVQRLLQFSKTDSDVPSFLQVHRSTIASLKAMNINDLSDFLLFELTFSNLNVSLQRKYDESVADSSIPTLESLFTFLEKQARAAELSIEHSRQSTTEEKRPPKRTFLTTLQEPGRTATCYFCSGSHLIYGCSKFKNLDYSARLAAVTNSGLCTNCLSRHKVSQCKSKNVCKACYDPNHHSLLHMEEERKPASAGCQPQLSASFPLKKPCLPKKKPPQVSLSANTSTTTSSSPSVILGTLQCYIQDFLGSWHLVKALLDPGSESSLVTRRLVDRLHLEEFPEPTSIVGVSNNKSQSQSSTKLLMFSKDYSNFYGCSASILPNICDKLPSSPIPTAHTEHLRKLPLADETFDRPSDVDILLGASAYCALLSEDQPNFLKGFPSAVKTRFGWVVLGSVPVEKSGAAKFCAVVTRKAVSRIPVESPYSYTAGFCNFKPTNLSCMLPATLRLQHQPFSTACGLVLLPALAPCLLHSV